MCPIVPSGYMTGLLDGLVDGSKLVDVCLKVEFTPELIIMDSSLDSSLSQKSGAQ